MVPAPRIPGSPYPIYHIDNIVKPVSKAGHATKVIFLTADAFGVLPPVAKLTKEQRPSTTSCPASPPNWLVPSAASRSRPRPSPPASARLSQPAPDQVRPGAGETDGSGRAEAYLVNTGWNGTGKRISIKDTCGIIDAILDGSIEKAPTKVPPVFNLEVPTELPGVNPAILDPRDTYADQAEWDAKAADLAGRFIKNFERFTDNDEGKRLVAAGPQL